LKAKLAEMKWQALHAGTLGIHHPLTGEYKEFTVPLPGDLERVIEYLKERRGEG